MYCFQFSLEKKEITCSKECFAYVPPTFLVTNKTIKYYKKFHRK